MNHEFFQVFPTLKAAQGDTMMFERVEVTKITTNAAKEYLKIHILSDHLIPKKYIG